jgi:hypothetical protein
VIAKAKNAKTLCFDHGRSRAIGSFLVISKVLSAVQLDYQSGCVTQEVGDIIFDRDLAPEANSDQAMIAQFGPEHSLSVS